MMRTIIALVLAALLSLCMMAAAADKGTPPLAAQYQKWLDEVHWIISDYERSAFLQLQNDADRDRFIKAFWDSRDPTPGTEKNEFKEEHYRRFQYAQEKYGRDQSAPGWRSDRGRIYILLGKPQFVQTGGDLDLQPMELWQYTGLREYGLPGSLYLIFYRKGGYGPFRLYSPLMDGIRELFEHRAEFELQTEEDLFNHLQTKVNPELAHAALSYIPTEGGWMGFDSKETGSLTTEVVLADLQNARNYKVKERTYVQEVLKDHPEVKVYYTLGAGGVQNYLFWALGPNGHFYIDFAVQYQPNRLEMAQYDEDIYTSLALDGQIASSQQQPIDEIKSTHEIHLTPQKFETIKELPFQLQGRRPIIPGNFGLTMVIVNNVSRQSVTVTSDFSIPDMASYQTPYFTPLLPIRKVENAQEGERKQKPFQFGSQIFTPCIPAKYQVGSIMPIFHQLIFPLKTDLVSSAVTLTYLVRKNQTVEFETTDSLSMQQTRLAGQTIDVRKDIPLKGLSPGKRTLTVELRSEGKVLSSSQPLEFEIEQAVSTGLWKFSIAMPDYDSPYHLTMLSQQYIRANRLKEALDLMEQALKTYPDSSVIRVGTMQTAMKAQKFERVLEVGAPLEISEPRNKEVMWLMGWANYGLRRYDEAVRFFERLLLEDPDRIEVLNMLADAYYRLDQPARSLERIQRSLALKPDQADILELKKKVEATQK